MSFATKTRLAILSIDRSPSYVHAMLASLLASDRLVHRLAGIHVFAGSQDAGYLDCYRQHRRIQIVPLESSEWERIRDWGPHRRCCHNYHRCLSLDLGGASGLCICEDDVVFCDQFIEKLAATVTEMEAAHGLTRYLLACYAAYRFSNDPTLHRGRFFTSYPADSFYGTQCMYYPATVIGDLKDRMLQNGVEKYKKPSDWIVRGYGKEINGIYACSPSLAQHIGRRTTGLGDFHESPTFQEQSAIILKSRLA